MSVTQEVEALSGEISPLLHGRAPDIVGAVLADLTAMWLAGHVVQGDPEAAENLREQLLLMHVRTIERLTIVYARLIGADLAAQPSDGEA